MTAQQRFEALYEQHAAAVSAYTHRRIARSDADDVIAEVFLTAWKRLEDIPPDARVWLLGVARRVLANKRRGQGRQAALALRLGEQSRGGPDRDADAGISGEQIREALQSLSETDRETLLLLGWEGLSNDEAARVLGIRTATFAVRLHRARRKFSRALAVSATTTAKPTEPGMTMEAR